MLKRISINSHQLPVPIPIKNLQEALDWIESSFLNGEQIITKVCLNGIDIEDCSNAADNSKVTLTPDYTLEIQIESPKELLLQSLDTILNLTKIVQRGLKDMAVECWQLIPKDTPSQMEQMEEDIDLILALHEQMHGLVDVKQIDLAAMRGQYILLNNHFTAIRLAKSNSDWQKIAKILLNRMEPLFKEMVEELQSLHNKALEIESRPLTKEFYELVL